MATIAALVESHASVTALRRTLPPGGPRVAHCRTVEALARALETKLVDAIVLAPTMPVLAALAPLRTHYPAIPVIAYAAFRPDDGDVLRDCFRAGIQSVAVEGVDDAVIGELVVRRSLSSVRRAALADAPRVLRLEDQLQKDIWELAVSEVERPLRTQDLAKRLEISREHLSRQAGAGGAPNLKRLIDLARVACAAQLLQNPGHTVNAVVRILGFASASHLSGTVRRIANARTRNLAALGPRGVLAAFARGNTRSRK